MSRDHDLEQEDGMTIDEAEEIISKDNDADRIATAQSIQYHQRHGFPKVDPEEERQHQKDMDEIAARRDAGKEVEAPQDFALAIDARWKIELAMGKLVQAFTDSQGRMPAEILLGAGVWDFYVGVAKANTVIKFNDIPLRMESKVPLNDVVVK